MGKYNFSVTRKNEITGQKEELTVVGCDSFDEARRLVEKALHERELIEKEAIVAANSLPQGGFGGGGTGSAGYSTTTVIAPKEGGGGGGLGSGTGPALRGN